MHADWLKILFVQLDGDTELSASCWCSDGASKENFHFDNQSKQVVFLFLVAVFSKRNRKTCTLCFYQVLV